MLQSPLTLVQKSRVLAAFYPFWPDPMALMSLHRHQLEEQRQQQQQIEQQSMQPQQQQQQQRREAATSVWWEDLQPMQEQAATLASIRTESMPADQFAKLLNLRPNSSGPEPETNAVNAAAGGAAGAVEMVGGVSLSANTACEPVGGDAAGRMGYTAALQQQQQQQSGGSGLWAGMSAAMQQQQQAPTRDAVLAEAEKQLLALLMHQQYPGELQDPCQAPAAAATRTDELLTNADYFSSAFAALSQQQQPQGIGRGSGVVCTPAEGQQGLVFNSPGYDQQEQQGMGGGAGGVCSPALAQLQHGLVLNDSGYQQQQEQEILLEAVGLPVKRTESSELLDQLLPSFLAEQQGVPGLVPVSLPAPLQPLQQQQCSQGGQPQQALQLLHQQQQQQVLGTDQGLLAAAPFGALFQQNRLQQVLPPQQQQQQQRNEQQRQQRQRQRQEQRLRRPPLRQRSGQISAAVQSMLEQWEVDKKRKEGLLQHVLAKHWPNTSKLPKQE